MTRGQGPRNAEVAQAEDKTYRLTVFTSSMGEAHILSIGLELRL